jgi:EAL domain-containing protein (putative c-di-GMP-specific phosphodiesterase class I)
MTKILVIEDEDSVRDNLLDMLEAEDFETLAAANGRIGIQLAISEVPDLILCDLMMPEVDGFSVLTTLRQDSTTAGIPFIFLSAKSARGDIRQGMDLGADDYLTKPFTRAELLSAIISRLEKQAIVNKFLSTKPSVNDNSVEFKVLENSLRRALERGQLREFQVYYQPIVDITTGKVISAESLLRWQSPELGVVSPSELIPLAESTGLMVPIGEWILRRVCKQIKTWSEDEACSLTVAVNVSASQLKEANFIQTIADTLFDYDLPPQCLELEFTESIIMQDVNHAIATMKELQNMGVRIAIDDFGTGNSSLIYLKQFPINTLKIDRYFIHNVDIDLQKSAITAALIQMAYNLNFQVVAKGVETEGELAYLRHHNCPAVQGFLFSRPVPLNDFEDMWRAKPTLSA